MPLEKGISPALEFDLTPSVYQLNFLFFLRGPREKKEKIKNLFAIIIYFCYTPRYPLLKLSKAIKLVLTAAERLEVEDLSCIGMLYFFRMAIVVFPLFIIK